MVVIQNKEKVRRAKHAVLSAEESFSLQDIIGLDPVAFQGVRMLYSTSSSGTELQVKESDRHVLSGIFSKNNIFAYSDAIFNEMQYGTSAICYKRRVLLDTNFLSDLPRYFLGEELNTRDKVEDVLTIIKDEYCGGFDYGFSMLENLREFARDNNPHPVNKVAAAIYFDHLVRGEAKAWGSRIDVFEPYIAKAEAVWMNFRSSSDAWDMVDRRDLIYAVMLKTFHMCWSQNGLTIERALNSLVDYCLAVLGVVPLKELYFAWKAIVGFSVGYYTPVFDEADLKTPKKGSIGRIGALAWDLYMFRFSEMLLSEEKGNSFYIPSITTLDKGLLDTISACPVKAMISFDDFRFIETIFEDELLFQQCLESSLSISQYNMMMDGSRSLQGSRKPKHYMLASIAEIERYIKALI